MGCPAIAAGLNVFCLSRTNFAIAVPIAHSNSCFDTADVRFPNPVPNLTPIKDGKFDLEM
jgi:hypothetical protein